MGPLNRSVMTLWRICDMKLRWWVCVDYYYYTEHMQVLWCDGWIWPNYSIFALRHIENNHNIYNIYAFDSSIQQQNVYVCVCIYVSCPRLIELKRHEMDMWWFSGLISVWSQLISIFNSIKKNRQIRETRAWMKYIQCG